MLKQLLCVGLSASLVAGTSCSTQTRSNQDPKPMPAAETKQLEKSQEKLSKSSGKPLEFKLQTAKLDKAISTLLEAGNLAIKDSNGLDVSFDQYKKNPTQYFLLMKLRPSANEYKALKTSVVSDLKNQEVIKKNNSISLSFEVFDLSGPTANFKSSDLPDPVINEVYSFNTSGSTIANLNNIAEMKSLLDRIKDKMKIASAPNTLEQIQNFIFPTAYAADYQDSLMITAIVFSGVSVVSYLLGAFPLGNLSAVGGLVFWLLFAFEDQK